jgi:hypothetical protein
MLLDIGRDMDWFDIFKIGESGSLAPVQELADRLVIRNPGKNEVEMADLLLLLATLAHCSIFIYDTQTLPPGSG